MIRLVRAPNPGPMTLEGTNTWLLGSRRVLVVDPGPEDPAHVAGVLATVQAGGGTLGGVLLTHRHSDHSGALAVPALREELSRLVAPVLAGDPTLGRPPEAAELARCTDVPVAVLAVPGHTDDSVAVVLPAERAVCTGDTVLGRGPSVVAHPDGDLTDYLGSLARLGEVCSVDHPGRPWRGLPGHGPELPDLGAALRSLTEHRQHRLSQVRAALVGHGGDDHPGDSGDDEALLGRLLQEVYPDLTDPVLVAAARWTLAATLVHLGRGRDLG